MKTFAKSLQELIDENKLTPYELAQKSGVRKETIYALLRETSKTPTLKVLKKLAKGLGLKTWQLVKRTVSD